MDNISVIVKERSAQEKSNEWSQISQKQNLSKNASITHIRLRTKNRTKNQKRLDLLKSSDMRRLTRDKK